jgi:hypothetical protein
MRVKNNTPCVCEYCGNDFLAVKSSLGRFCSLTCAQRMKQREKLHGRASWFNCCKCHAKIGFGIYKSGQLVGKDKGVVGTGIRAAEIKRYEPPAGSWAAYASKITQKSRVWWGGDEIAKLWMDEYNAQFPTWSRMAGIKKLEIWITKYLKDDHAVRDHAKKSKIKNRKSSRESERKRKIIDPGFRVKCNLRRRLRTLMKSTKKGGSRTSSSLIGCSTKQLAKHLESQFSKGMSWENYGIDGWHVDHILPCSSFDHNDPRQVAQCWHWTNLRPLWAKENMLKSDEITEPQMNLMLGGMH